MADDAVEGDGVAPVIVFPLHRVTSRENPPTTGADRSLAHTGVPRIGVSGSDSLFEEGDTLPEVIVLPNAAAATADVDSGSTPEAPEGGRGSGLAADEAGLADVPGLRERIKTIESSVISVPRETDAPAPDKEARRAKNIALHQLGASGRSEAEVRDRLRAREISPAVVEEEVAHLIEVGLIDDHALATDLVDTLRVRKKLGDRAITQTLRQRKIPNDIITQVLDASEFDSDIAVFELAKDRARSVRHLDADVAFRRLVGFIQRRGYSGPQVFEAARRALESRGDTHEVSS